MYWSLIGAVATRLAGLINSVVIARHLGIADFGRYGIVQSTLGTVGFFAGLGMGLVATKHIAELVGTDRERASRILSLSLLTIVVTGLAAALTFFAAAPWISRSMLNDPGLGHILRLMTPLIALSTLNGVQTAALGGFRAFREMAKINIAVAVLTVPAIALGAIFGGLTGACIAVVSITGVTCFATHVAMSRKMHSTGLRFSLKGAFKERQLLYSFAFPTLIAGALVEPVHWFCATVIVNQSGFREIGAYYAAMQWGTALVFLPAILGQVVFPIMSEAFGQGDRTKVAKLLTLHTIANAVISGIFLVALGAGSRLIMGLYGGQVAEHWLTFVVVIGTAAILAVQWPVGLVIAASNRMWAGLVMNLGWAIAFVMLTYLLADRGALGLAGARAGAYVLHAVWTTGYAFHVFRLLRVRHV